MKSFKNSLSVVILRKAFFAYERQIFKLKKTTEQLIGTVTDDDGNYTEMCVRPIQETVEGNYHINYGKRSTFLR